MNHVMVCAVEATLVCELVTLFRLYATTSCAGPLVSSRQEKGWLLKSLQNGADLSVEIHSTTN